MRRSHGQERSENGLLILRYVYLRVYKRYFSPFRLLRLSSAAHLQEAQSQSELHTFDSSLASCGNQRYSNVDLNPDQRMSVHQTQTRCD